VASDAEETMTQPPHQRHAGPPPDGQRPAAPYDPPAAPPKPNAYDPSASSAPYETAGGAPNGTGGARPSTDFPPPPLGPLASNGAPGPSQPGVPPYGTPVGEAPISEAERTVTDEPTPGAGTPPYATAGSGWTPPDDQHAETFATPPYGATDASAAGPSVPGGPSGHFASVNAESGAAQAANGANAAAAPSPGTGGRSATFVNGQATLALARLSTRESANAGGPALTPDAILPPGTPPEAPPEPPPHDPHATQTGPIPRLSAGPGFPGGPPAGGLAGASGARRALLVGGGLVAALLLGGGGALAVTQLSGGSTKEHKVAQTPPPAPTPTPTPTPSPTRTKAKHKPKHIPIDIRDEKTDPQPLTIGEVFPSKTLNLAGNKFVLAKTVINDHCSLAANGPFATELTGEHCRRVVRATFVSTDKKLAVTTGIAVMPTDAAARAVVKVQDPAHYKWFRGMKATGAPKIDAAGGYAASTLRGRYIAYAYATYVDGHKPASNDNTLKTVGTAFRDSTVRPIDHRAKQH
jgi:hypothetical protein